MKKIMVMIRNRKTFSMAAKVPRSADKAKYTPFVFIILLLKECLYNIRLLNFDEPYVV